MSKTQEERETIIRFDDSSDEVNLYTASPTVMKRWVKQGYPVKVKSTFQGEETGWNAICPLRVISFRGIQKKAHKPNQGFKKRITLSPDKTTLETPTFPPLNPS